MTIHADGKYRIQLLQTRGLGAPWMVRVYKKHFLHSTRISSDWFLDEAQARRFADQLKKSLTDGPSMNNLLTRKPGWTLERPPR